MTEPSPTPPDRPDDGPEPAADLQRLSARLDGELSAAERTRLEGDLAADDDLRSALAEFQEVERVLDAWEVADPSEDFTDRTVAAAFGETAAEPSRHRVWTWTAAAAAVLVAVGVAWSVRGDGTNDAATGALDLSERELEAIARDLDVLAHLDALESSDDEELIRLADDLDLLDEIGPSDPIRVTDVEEER